MSERTACFLFSNQGKSVKKRGLTEHSRLGFCTPLHAKAETENPSEKQVELVLIYLKD